MEKHQIEYANNVIDFVVKRKKVKNVNLNVKPDMTIEVTANDRVPLDFISDFVKSKGSWIIKNIGRFNDVQPLKQSKREYVSGETFRYLGKQYRLRVQKTTEEEMVKYFRGFIYLHVKDTDNLSRKEKLMDEWYREKAQMAFNESLEKMFPLVQKYGIEKPEVDVRLMKARWGSAIIEKNTILLNTELIKAPKYCIDYVVLHELIHFKYNDHSDNFYQMLYSLIPDWEKRKAILDEEIVREL
ncbi:SprT family zinc-dependent metalloprotease [Fredinandcohnia onubensis]|uniref:YgjP family zinc-dependent metalloprotease n=1 Tax=Fredinandcohnia onubensis TaxID=1571209 RepID=UPI000C0BCC7C|nr:SprT family zinc-dependent metalloprotease [Fredinandcohnia onubensis]